MSRTLWLMFAVWSVGCFQSREPGGGFRGDAAVPEEAGAREAGPPACTPSRERCDTRAVDEDCDGRVDEHTCRPGETCSRGECVCAATCGTECADLERDPDHCGACGHRCADDEGCVDGVCCGVATERLDVLVLVENDDQIANWMQRTLLRDLPALLRPLMTGDHDSDGRIDHPPVADLHLGVISPDIGGSSEASLPRCGEGLGDDGLLLEREPPRRNGCDEVRPPFLQWRGAGDPDEFVRQAGCATRMGVLGCDVLQPLEAVLKALTPASSPIRFFDGTRGHGDGAHADFLRPDSFLLVLIVSTEDDCSASDPQLYDLYDHDTPLDLLCIDHPEWLFETSRYVQGYAALRPPGRFHFAVLGGAPPDLVSESDDYSGILADPRMFPEGDPLDFRYVRPLCEIEPLGEGWTTTPTRRLVQVADGLAALGHDTSVSTLCAPTLVPAAELIARRVAERLNARCE